MHETINHRVIVTCNPGLSRQFRSLCDQLVEDKVVKAHKDEAMPTHAVSVHEDGTGWPTNRKERRLAAKRARKANKARRKN